MLDQQQQHFPIEENTFKLLQLQHPVLNAELVHMITNTESHRILPLTIGATLPGYIDRQLKIEKETFRLTVRWRIPMRINRQTSSSKRLIFF